MSETANTKNFFGEVASLQAVFAENKNRRQGRQPTHVLVVEDDPLTACVVAGAFSEAHAMFTAGTAREAITSYLLHAPDIVFLDIGLPDANGFTVLEQIRKIDPEAFIVMFSATHSPETVTRAEKAGAAGFVGKPFRKEHLHRYIQGSAIHHRKFGTAL